MPFVRIFIDAFHLEAKTSPRQTSALGGAPITGTKIPSKRKLAVNEVCSPLDFLPLFSPARFIILGVSR